MRVLTSKMRFVSVVDTYVVCIIYVLFNKTALFSIDFN